MLVTVMGISMRRRVLRRVVLGVDTSIERETVLGQAQSDRFVGRSRGNGGNLIWG